MGVSVNAGGDDLLGTSGNLNDATTNVINTDGSTPVGYTPQQIRAAYGINQITFGSTPGTGTGQTIAIIDPYDDPDIASDVAEFDQLFDLPSINLTVVNQQGASSPLPATDPTGDSEYEEALDVEWAHAIAPGANIVLVECNSNTDSDLFTGASTAAALSGVSVVLMSFVWQRIQQRDVVRQPLHHPERSPGRDFRRRRRAERNGHLPCRITQRGRGRRHQFVSQCGQFLRRRNRLVFDQWRPQPV